MKLTTDEWTRLYLAGTVYQVFLDGKDVTKRCAYADDEAGVVRLFERDPVDNSVRLDKKGKPHWFELTGAVELRKLSRDEWDRYFGD